MDTKFQTSFIPKKPILAGEQVIKTHGSTSVFMFISVIIFIASVSVAVLLLVWKSVLIKNQENYTLELKKAEERFDTVTIEKLKKANTKIDLTKKLLKDHMAVSEVFSIISALTIEGVRFKSFSFSAPAKEIDGVNLAMKGVGNSFSAIAFQSDVFGKSSKFGKNKVLKNPIISDLVLDDNGNVAFSFITTIDVADLSYEKLLTTDESVE